jgi:hypothetical protein
MGDGLGEDDGGVSVTGNIADWTGVVAGVNVGGKVAFAGSADVITGCEVGSAAVAARVGNTTAGKPESAGTCSNQMSQVNGTMRRINRLIR